MFQVRKGIHFVIFSYIILCLLIWHYKPSIMFEDNKIKKFGLGYGKTIWNYQITIIILAFMNSKLVVGPIKNIFYLIKLSFIKAIIYRTFKYSIVQF